MATTKLYLDLRGKAKDGKGNVIITIAQNRTTTSISTGVRISKKDWDGKKVINRPDKDILNAVLSDKKNQVDKKIAVLQLSDNFNTMSAPEIKKSIDSNPKKVRDRHSVASVFEDYLMKPDLKLGTKEVYLTTLKKINAYGKPGLKIDDIDYKWVLGFDRYLAQTQSLNGRAIYLRSLRAICNYAVKTRLIQNYAFESFSIKQEETKKRNVPIDKLRELYNFPCKPHQVVYRDFFFLMFFLIGMEAVDLFNVKPDTVQNGRLEYIRSKTGKRFSVKIEPEAQNLLCKYAGKDYLVNVMDRCKSYKNYLHEMNDELGRIGPEVWARPISSDLFSEPDTIKTIEPIVPDLTSKWARHTWATLAVELGIPVDTISQALGHSMGRRTTLIYIKPDQTKVDDANRKVIDYLLGITKT